jgi:hypothetical protein
MDLTADGQQHDSFAETTLGEIGTDDRMVKDNVLVGNSRNWMRPISVHKISSIYTGDYKTVGKIPVLVDTA